MRKITIIILYCFTFIHTVKSDLLEIPPVQTKLYYETGLSSWGSVENKMPFWFRVNKSGLLPDENHVTWDFEIYKKNVREKKINWNFGVMGGASVASKTSVLLRDYFVGLDYNQVKLSFGAKANEIAYDGLSSTNGDFIESLNARPYPQLKLSIDYTDIPFTKGWLQFKGVYSEGMMIDERHVKDTRVHYKNLYVKVGKRKLNFEVGLKHFAQWGGEASDRGKLATGWKVYYDLILAKDNSRFDALGSDIDYNRVGNHIGMYDVKLTYKTDKFIASVYRQVIFEDSSGRNFTNRDALLGIYLKRLDKKAWLQAVLLEYYYTKYQSGTLTGPKPEGGIYTGKDNYFNNSVYRSGWTHYGNTVGTPLFTPSNDKAGVAHGIMNNRIVALHGGIYGYILQNCSYKMLLTYSQNYGTYSAKIDSVETQMSGYLEVVYSVKKIAADISLGIASDFAGSYLTKNTGVFIKISTHGWWGK